MDVFGTVVNVTTLVGQIVIIYRHVAAMQSFGDAAEGVTAKISFEYFRFETWAEQSGYLEIKDRDGLTSEAAQSAQSNTGSHYLLQTAAKAHEIVAQIQNVLAATRLLLEKNQISDKLTDAAGSTSLQPDLSVTQPSIIAKTTARQQFLSLPSSVSSMPAIERATAASSKLKLRLGKETGRLRKLRFSWGLFGEDSDMAKLEDLVQQLRYWNDGLRQGMESEATRVVVEIVDFSAISHQDSLEILNTRIGRLSHLLRAAARPSNLYLPTCEGYVRASASKFFILYRPPEQADPFKQPRTLLCLLPRHPNAPKRPPRMPILPSLEERYSLAKQLAEGLLRLHSISWLHKCFNSNNILFFHSPDGLSISHPVLVGFGLGRTSDKTSETIDVRQLGSHFDLYQHPELRADAHKRYKKRHDIYSLGLVLFEIGIWQSIFYFKKDNQDAQDFRRTIRNACESHLAHFMGKAYQRAVLQCLDEDDMWKEAEGDDDDDDSSEIHEVFFWKVVRELGGVQ
ncbi:hypothetical protein ACHAO5_007756 [Verticillium nonalfalfae]